MKVQRIKKIAVIGLGIMGPGIAQVCAQAGYETSVTDKNAGLFPKALKAIELNLLTLAGKGVINKGEVYNALARIKKSKNLVEAAADADFVIEAVVEDINVKKRLFRQLAELCPKQTILATNTSSFSVTEIASVTERQDMVVGMHWWNPPYLMPLVEIIRGEKTSSETIQATRDLVTRLGKTPVICKDSPGFIGVRIQAALVMEAISILDEGLASAKDIDTAVKMSLGFRLPIIGPLETVDLGGMDTFLYAYEYLHEKLGDKYRPPDLLKRKVKAGEFGIKTGKGFYEYTTESVESMIKRRDEWLIDQLKTRRDANTS